MQQQEFEFFLGELCAQLRVRSPACHAVANAIDASLAQLKNEQAKLADAQRVDRAVKETSDD